MGRKIDQERDLKLQGYVFQQMDNGNPIDTEKASQYSGYNKSYLEEIFSERGIIEQIVARVFPEKSFKSEDWLENFNERIRSLKFWATNLKNEEFRNEINEYIEDELIKSKERK